MSRVHGWSLIVAALMALAARGAAAQQLDTTWDRFDFAHRPVTRSAVANLSLEQLRQLRAVIFGRHGRPFADEPELHGFLQAKRWYHADPKFTNVSLTANERASLDVVRAAEARKH